ncbi:hypothetical protein BDF19DRAFT_11749 [Syncephalis fuscata]|nr:hypothetical protein BDF19DRAFT_11749 [Syncephalis fuscata]
MAPHTIFSQQERSKPVATRTCCCCSCLVFTIIFVILSIGLAIALFFIWPRMPDVDYLGLRTINAPSATDSTFSGKYDAILRLDNKNYISWTIEKMNVKVYDKGTDKLIGNGTLAGVDIPARQMYNLLVPINLNYQGDKNDAEVARLVAICASPHIPIPATIEAKLNLRGLAVFSLEPTIKQDITITCPDQ